MNSTASGPATSILPRVEASKIPSEARVARHSRATAASMSSPARGKWRARRHWATGSKTAPCASAQASMGVLRTASKCPPRWWPAKAPKVVGV